MMSDDTQADGWRCLMTVPCLCEETAILQPDAAEDGSADKDLLTAPFHWTALLVTAPADTLWLTKNQLLR
jgi:hypothetical protein